MYLTEICFNINAVTNAILKERIQSRYVAEFHQKNNVSIHCWWIWLIQAALFTISKDASGSKIENYFYKLQML